MTQILELVFACLALLCVAFILVVVLTKVCAGFVPAAADFWSQLTDALDGRTFWLACAVSGTATLGSLYFSEIANFRPCFFCWMQRGGIFPLPIILAILAVLDGRAVRTGDPDAVSRVRRFKWLVVAFNCYSIPVSLYHIAIEINPSLEATTCDINNPCTTPWFKAFGFMTLAQMALVTAATVLTLMLMTRVRPALDAGAGAARVESRAA